MNERIKKLAEQALPNIKYWNDELAKEIEAPINRAVTVYELEKFSELIVQECLLSLEPDLYSKEIDYEFEQRFYKRCRDKIIKHFGGEY